jgi:DNA repair photolyase
MPQLIQSKTILNKTKRRDDWFLDDYTLNPYSGCSFNCLYCYIRGSKYGINMEDKLSIKENAVQLLERQLQTKAKKNQFGYIVLSSATDPYLQFEKSYALTRKLLEVILRFRFPVHIITKSDLVERDFDLLKEIDAVANLPLDLKNKPGRGALITFSFSTVDETVRSVFEPGATPISFRLKTLEKASKEGFKTGVSMMPLLPYISDSPEVLENMFEVFRAAGAHYVMPASLTLFGDNASDGKTLVLRALSKHFPDLVDQYHKLFSYGFSVPRAYQQNLERLTNELNARYNIPNRII